MALRRDEADHLVALVRAVWSSRAPVALARGNLAFVGLPLHLFDLRLHLFQFELEMIELLCSFVPIPLDSNQEDDENGEINQRDAELQPMLPTDACVGPRLFG